MMTRKHYTAIAEVINSRLDESTNYNLCHVVDGLCKVFAEDNPNFNRELFVKATGVWGFINDARKEPA